MKKKFTNDKIIDKQSFELLKSGVKICKKTFFDTIEYEIPYEHLGNKKTVTSSVNHGTLFIAFFFLVVGLLYSFGNSAAPFFFFTGSIIMGAFAFASRKKVITIACFGNTNIVLFYRNSNEMEIRELADTLIDSANQFLLNKHSKIDRNLPIENQLNSIQFLLEREIIDEAKFEELKNQLFGKENKSIGYSK